MDNEKHNGEGSPTKKSCAIWRRRTLLERYLILICFAVFIALLVAIGFALHEKHIYKRSSSSRSLSSTCLSPECTQEAERIINYMDTSVDPCEDFYNFTCGSYLKAPPNSYSDSAFNNEARESITRLTKELLEEINEEEGPEFLKKVKKYYKSCLNSSRDVVEFIEEFLEKTKFEKWPILEDDEAYMKSLEKSFAISSIYGNDNPFFTMFFQDPGGIHFIFGKTFVPEQVLLNKTDMKYIEKKKKYTELLEYTLFRLKVPLRDLEYLVNEIIEFETDFANIAYKHRRNLIEEKPTEVKTTLKKVSSNCTGITWTFVIRNIFDHFGRFDDFSEEIPVTHLGKEYMENLCKLLSETSHRTVYNFLVWSLLIQELSGTQVFYRRIILEIKSDVDSSLDRWKFCVSDIIDSDDFLPAVNYLALLNLQRDETKVEIERYADEFKEGIIQMVRDNNWMSSVTKDSAIQTLENLSSFISYSPKSLNVDMIEEYFEQFNITDNLLENRLRILEHDARMDFFEEISEFLWNISITHPIMISAHYLEGAIVVSLGYLTPPNFRLGMPKYYNYGSVGVVISRELTHAIVENIGNSEPTGQFKEKVQCYIDQYSKFDLVYEGSRKNNTMTVKEDIADNVAIGQAFKVYEKYLEKNGPEESLPGLEFTNEQMFFIRYGQSLCGPPKNYVHKYHDPSYSPGGYRATGSLQNFPRFSKVFNCPSTSAMNPRHKCDMF